MSFRQRVEGESDHSPSGPSGSSLVEKLRSASRESHETLDNAVFVDSITASPQACLEYLEKFSSAFREAQALINWKLAREASLPDLEERTSRYLQLPGMNFLPAETEADLPITLGALYVTEGSIHGGSLILKKLTERHAIDDLRPFRFLQGFEGSNHESWKSFVDWLKGFSLSEKESESACIAAVRTFEIFREKLA